MMSQPQDTGPAVIVQPTRTLVWAPVAAGAFVALIFTAVATVIVLSLIPVYLPRKDVNVNIVRNQPTTTSATGTKLQTFSAEYHVKYMNLTPDGVERPVLTINGQYPGPIIVVDRGTIINITVFNEFDETSSVHWHGLVQRQTTQMDGVPGVTQCSILPNQSYVYTFSTSDQATGTYWFHSHSAVQLGDGLQGALIINDLSDPWRSSYSSDELFFMTEWNHTPFYDLLKVFLSVHELEPIPDTALINGIGQYNCTPTGTCRYPRIFIQKGTTIRIRLINTSLYSKITFTIDQHVLRIIEADGIPMNGDKYVRTVRTNPGQRYSVLVTAKENPSPSYWIRATLHPYFAGTGIYVNATQPTASAILQYITDNNTNVPIIVPSMDTFNNDDDVIDQSFLEGEEFADEIGLVPIYNATTRVFPTGPVVSMVYNMTITPSHPQIIFDPNTNTTVTEPGPQIMFAFNNHTFTHPVTQTILAAVITSNADASSPTTIQLNKGDIIDLVINNQNPVTHPMHLHGHHSWIIGVGLINDGYSDGTVLTNSIYNTTNPMFRDTISVNAYSYLIFRFQADNPGVWIMHCHNDWHLNLGMALVFVEAPAEVTNYYLNNPSTSIPTTCPAFGSGERRR